MRVQPKVKLLRYTDPDRKSLAKAAAIFLGKDDEDNVKRPLNLLKNGHTSIFRGEHARFEFWTSKVVYDHLVTYTTLEMRACGGFRANEAGEFVIPLEAVGTEFEQQIYRVGNSHLIDYRNMISGIDPETHEPQQKMRLQAARAVAPISVQIHYILQFNFLTLMEAVFPQRIWEPGSQPDTKEVVQMMFALVWEQDHELWELAREIFGPEAIAWKKLRYKLKNDDPELFDQIMQKYGQMKSMWDKNGQQ